MYIHVHYTCKDDIYNSVHTNILNHRDMSHDVLYK